MYIYLFIKTFHFFRPIPEFPSESTACVVYEIQSGSTPERDLFELVKKHSKRSGVPIDIQLESTTEPGWKKARVHYYRLDTDGLKADKSLILGRPPKFRVYYPTRLVFMVKINFCKNNKINKINIFYIFQWGTEASSMPSVDIIRNT